MNKKTDKSENLDKIILYMVLSFGISCLIWVIYRLKIFGEFNDKVIYLAASGPTVGTFLTLLITEGKKGVRKFGGFFTKWNSPAIYYLAAVFLMPIILMGSSYLFPVEGVNWMGRLAEKLPSLVPVFIILTIQAGLGEEIGWRGFLTPELNKFMPLDIAAILTGVIWTSWHLPLFFTPGTFQANLIEVIGFAPAFFGYMLFLMASSVLYSFFYRNANNNIMIPILFHGSLNAATWLVEANMVLVNVRPLFTNTLTLMVIALIIVSYSRLIRKKANLYPAVSEE